VESTQILVDINKLGANKRRRVTRKFSG